MSVCKCVFGVVWCVCGGGGGGGGVCVVLYESRGAWCELRLRRHPAPLLRNPSPIRHPLVPQPKTKHRNTTHNTNQMQHLPTAVQHACDDAVKARMVEVHVVLVHRPYGRAGHASRDGVLRWVQPCCLLPLERVQTGNWSG